MRLRILTMWPACVSGLWAILQSWEKWTRTVSNSTYMYVAKRKHKDTAIKFILVPVQFLERGVCKIKSCPSSGTWYRIVCVAIAIEVNSDLTLLWLQTRSEPVTKDQWRDLYLLRHKVGLKMGTIGSKVWPYASRIRLKTPSQVRRSWHTKSGIGQYLPCFFFIIINVLITV